MRELKGYRDPYYGYKRTSAWSGPYTCPHRRDFKKGVALAVAIGLLLAVCAFLELSK
jgi:hypothetical protein